MVQDTGVGTEVYQAVGRKGEILVFGMEEEVEEEDEGDAQVSAGTRARCGVQCSLLRARGCREE